MDMIWKGTRLNKRCNGLLEQRPSPDVKKTACIAQRQDCIKPHIWESVKKKQFCCIEGSQKHVASIIHNGRCLEQPGLFLELAS